MLLSGLEYGVEVWPAVVKQWGLNWALSLEIVFYILLFIAMEEILVYTGIFSITLFWNLSLLLLRNAALVLFKYGHMKQRVIWGKVLKKVCSWGDLNEQLWLFSDSTSWCTLALLSTANGHSSALAPPNHARVQLENLRERERMLLTHYVIYETQASNKGCPNHKVNKIVRNFEMIYYAFILKRHMLPCQISI